MELDPSIKGLLDNLVKNVGELPSVYSGDASWQEVPRRLQQEFLPRNPRAPSGYELCVRTRPCEDWLGKDLYDAIALPDGRLILLLGTIAGYGCYHTQTLVEIFSAIRKLTFFVHGPSEIVKLMDAPVRQVLERDFVPLFIGALDPVTNQLDYVNAAFEPPALLKSNADLIRLDASGPPLGFPYAIAHHPQSVSMDPGTLLCIWSDGIPEAFRSDRGLIRFGDENLLRIIMQFRGAPILAIQDKVFEAVDGFLDGAPQPDDMTLLILRRNPD